MKKTVLVCLGVLLIVVVGAWFLLFRELPVPSVTLSVPNEVELDSTLSMVITASNEDSRPITLDSIDVDDAFLSGFQVVTIDPEPKGTTHLPILDQRSWEFGQEIQPDGLLEIRFQLKAVSEGHFSGDLDVCNSNQDFKTLLVDIVVRNNS